MPYTDPAKRSRYLVEKRKLDHEWRERDRRKKREWYNANKEIEQARRRARRESMTPEQKEIDRQKKAEASLKYYRANRETQNAYSRNARRAEKVKRDESTIRPNPGYCENCGSAEKIRWHHDHASGQFVAWLCHNCNVIEGLAHSRPEVLEGIVQLLRTGIPVRMAPGMSTLKTLVAGAQNWHGELAC